MQTSIIEDKCTDRVTLDQWYAVAAIPEIVGGSAHRTVLLGFEIGYAIHGDAGLLAWRSDHSIEGGSQVDPSQELDWLPTRSAHGYLWVTLGEPDGEVFAIVETSEPDRRTLNAATVGIAVSAPRAVENFLDMAHFPYVHPNLLGVEPQTEVADYDVEMRGDELWAVNCRFYQPQASAGSAEGILAEYLYRVPHPYCATLYKSAPTTDDRLDVVGIFIQPVGQEFIRAHLFLSVIDDVSTDTELRRFQQIIISQDKPILENQNPRRLPLDPRAERPIRADRTSTAYRRWLRDLGVTYGVIPT